jgi:hypothetical protein
MTRFRIRYGTGGFVLCDESWSSFTYVGLSIFVFTVSPLLLLPHNNTQDSLLLRNRHSSASKIRR